MLALRPRGAQHCYTASIGSGQKPADGRDDHSPPRIGSGKLPNVTGWAPGCPCSADCQLKVALPLVEQPL